MGAIYDGFRSNRNQASRRLRKKVYFIFICFFIFGLYILCFYFHSRAFQRIYAASPRANLKNTSIRKNHRNPNVSRVIYPGFQLETNSNTMVIVNFPPLPPLRNASWKGLANFKELSRRQTVELLTTVFQEQLDHFLTNAPCNGYTLHCVHPSADCGLGCQIHHRAACVLLSYVTGLPLIHESSHASAWDEVFRKLGSNCEANNKTVYVKWSRLSSPILHLDKDCYAGGEDNCPAHKLVGYPLEERIPIPWDLVGIVQPNHDHIRLWYEGQFIRYALRYSPDTEKMIQDTRAAIQFDELQHVAGIYLRNETRQEGNFNRTLGKYMSWTSQYFQRVYSKDFSPRNVFVGSDDPSLMTAVRNLYTEPFWKIFGLDSTTGALNRTLSGRHVNSPLITLVRNVHFLSSSEHTVCELTSNACRLVVEMMATKYPDVWTRLKSVDGERYKFTYPLIGGDLTRFLWPIDPDGLDM